MFFSISRLLKSLTAWELVNLNVRPRPRLPPRNPFGRELAGRDPVGRVELVNENYFLV